jgi:hypothetical protein
VNFSFPQTPERQVFRSSFIAVRLFFLIVSVLSPISLWAQDSVQKPVPDAAEISTRTYQCQPAIDGYSGTVDTEIWALAPTTLLDKNGNASTDANNDGGESQVVMRFDDIIGDKELQVPPGSSIVSAKLVVSAFDQGDTVGLHRMLVPFGRAPTWDSLIAGVSADDIEASRRKDSFTFGKIAASTSLIAFDVTDTVQDWVNGHPNHGWAFINAGGNGWDFYAADFEIIKQRPKLVIVIRTEKSSSESAPSGNSK